MKYKRKWDWFLAHYREIASFCQEATDDGWTVHTILPTTRVANSKNGEVGDGAIIVAFKDEPDLSGGVPR